MNDAIFVSRLSVGRRDRIVVEATTTRAISSYRH